MRKKHNRLKKSQRTLAYDETAAERLAVFLYRGVAKVRDHEIICGFSVKMIPQKPDFLPVSQEEFVQSTLEAWAHGDEDSRVSDVLLGGVWEWGAFWKDESYKVRGAVACRASEEYQQKLVYDPITPVRERLAIYGTDKVRFALLEQGEPDKEVLENIAKYGSAIIRHRIVKEHGISQKACPNASSISLPAILKSCCPTLAWASVSKQHSTE